jgi:aspartyl-tRNA(Asn)/glutamyl-tRNA(Gln) amidotransferase subunit A
MMKLRTLAAQTAALASGQETSQELVAAALAAATDSVGEGARAFTKIYGESALIAAKNVDKRYRRGGQQGPLAGLPISIKDLFDIVGEPTTAGSVVLADAAPAVADGPVIARLRAAGAVLVGRTNMSEFAFSGLGINPHYGTPRNPYDRLNGGGRIPGGSSSGAAISVTDGMAAAAVGSDTGGSLRIPAALCGLTGFKPTASRVPLAGVLPLSPSLDSIGPIAPSVACCALLDAVLSGRIPEPLDGCDVRGLRGLRFGVLQGYVLDGLDASVARRFEAALSLLAGEGAAIEEVHFAELAQIPESNAKGGLTAAESYAWHRQLLAEHADRYDPRVLSRILRGKEMSAVDYLDVLAARQRIQSAAMRAFSGFDAWLVPAVPRIAPLIAELTASDAAYVDANMAMLRNPSVFNFLDCCALSIPCHLPGEAPVGLMVAARPGEDLHLLRIGMAIEAALAKAGCAMHG